MSTINFLFLGGAKRVAIADLFEMTAKEKKCKAKFYSYELSKHVPIARKGEIIIGLKWKDSNIINHLIEVIKKYKINIVLAFVDPAVEIASVLKNELQYVYIPVSKLDICKIMFNKREFANWMKSNSLPIPQTYSEDNIFYPAIFKPIEGSASKGIIIAKSKEDIHEDIKAENYTIQKFVENSAEYTVDCFVSEKQNILSIVPRIRLETVGGEVIRSMTIYDKKMIEISRLLIEKAKLTGPINIQFIKDLSTNELYVMEVNPRLGGGVVLSIHAGANIPGMMINEYLNYPNAECLNWKQNILMTRYFKEVIFDAANY